jgi:hypothetical protein
MPPHYLKCESDEDCCSCGGIAFAAMMIVDSNGTVKITTVIITVIMQVRDCDNDCDDEGNDYLRHRSLATELLHPEKEAP